MNTAFVIEQGRLVQARWCPSPNFNARPQNENGEVSLLVIHNISLPPAQFGTGCVQQFFCNQLDTTAHPYFAEIKDLQVSSHLFIERDGQITQFVNFNDRAWHAGKSCYQRRENCNDFSIGIELEGTDDLAYTQVQYEVLVAVTRALFLTYSKLHAGRITGHEQIAPQRKTDPGNAFNWQKLFQALLNKKDTL
jgi:AmpD protein